MLNPSNFANAPARPSVLKVASFNSIPNFLPACPLDIFASAEFKPVNAVSIFVPAAVD